MEKHCANCGAPIPVVDGKYARFCTHCGAAVEQSADVSDGYSSPDFYGVTEEPREIYSSEPSPNFGPDTTTRFMSEEDRRLASKGLFNIEASTRSGRGLGKDVIAGIAGLVALAVVVIVAFVLKSTSMYLLVFGAIFVIIAVGSFSHVARAKKVRRLIEDGETSVSSMMMKGKFRSREECLRTIKKMVESRQLVGYSVEDGERIVRK